jgi:outer membrane murein-binding lipoprotein Lpp
MPNTKPSPDIDLSQISTRNTHARHIVAGCASALPTLAGMWQELDDALADTATLAAHVTRLSADLERTRLDAANLRAAIRATLAAHAEGEPDPLWYLQDELNALTGPLTPRRGQP